MEVVCSSERQGLKVKLLKDLSAAEMCSQTPAARRQIHKGSIRNSNWPKYTKKIFLDKIYIENKNSIRK